MAEVLNLRGMLKEVRFLFWKECLLEFRQKHAFAGILLYVVSTIFVIYSALKYKDQLADLGIEIWNVLFWIVILFASVNAIAKSFFQENQKRMLYYYSIVSPQAFITAKMLYNMVVMIVLSLLTFGAFALLISNPVKQPDIFLLTIVLGATGYSFLFTLITAIAAKANNNATLVAILGFPIVLPLIAFIIKLSDHAFKSNPGVDMMKSVMILIALNVLLLTLSLVLFPYIWRD